MASTLLWLALAVAAGWVAGRAIGRWSNVSGWLNRVLQDPPPPVDDPAAAPATPDRHPQRTLR